MNKTRIYKFFLKHYLGTLFVVICLTLFYMFYFHILWDMKMGQLKDNFNVYHWMISDSLNADSPSSVVEKIVYVYGYYPPQTKFIGKDDPLAPIIEEGRNETILILLFILQKRFDIDYNGDLDKIIDTFGDAQTRDSYESKKRFRQLNKLPPLYPYPESLKGDSDNETVSLSRNFGKLCPCPETLGSVPNPETGIKN